jgi:hypothetical protein
MNFSWGNGEPIKSCVVVMGTTVFAQPKYLSNLESLNHDPL